MNLHNDQESFSSAIFRWKLNYEEFILERKDEKTVENYMNVINKFESFIVSSTKNDEKKFIDIDHKLLDEYFLYRDKTFGKNSIHLQKEMIKKF